MSAPGLPRRVVLGGLATIAAAPVACIGVPALALLPANSALAQAREGYQVRDPLAAPATPADAAHASPERRILLPGDSLESERDLYGLSGPQSGGGRYGAGFWEVPRTLWLRRPESGEEIRATYWADGVLIQQEYDRLCWFMRDLRMQRLMQRTAAAGRPVPADWYFVMGMNVRLLDIFYALGAWLEMFGLGQPQEFLSGFRHPYTNANTEGAARNSKHQDGEAGDARARGVSADRMGAFSQWLQGGGVGIYTDADFTHVDVGRIRTWRR